MGRLYLLNSAVITAPGLYRYRLISLEEARQLVRENEFVSAIGHEETARVLSQLLNVNVPVARIMISMNPGDIAIVFRLRIRPPEVTVLQLPAEAYEIGLLERLE